MVEEWLADKPGSWGFLAGKAVVACRKKLGRSMNEGERRRVWATLWDRLTALREVREQDSRAEREGLMRRQESDSTAIGGWSC